MSPSTETLASGRALWLSPDGLKPFRAGMAHAKPLPPQTGPLIDHRLPWRRPWLWLSPALSVEALLPRPQGMRRREIGTWLSDLMAPALNVAPHQVLSCHRQVDGERLLVSAIAASTVEPWLTVPARHRPRGLQPWLSVCHDRLRLRAARWALCLPHERGQTLMRWRDGRPVELLDHPHPGLGALTEHRAGAQQEVVILIDPLNRWPSQDALPDCVQTHHIAP